MFDNFLVALPFDLDDLGLASRGATHEARPTGVAHVGTFRCWHLPMGDC